MQHNAETRAINAKAERIRQANRTDDFREIRRIMDGLRHLTYAGCREYFAACDPTIDADRFEELCQEADYA